MKINLWSLFGMMLCCITVGFFGGMFLRAQGVDDGMVLFTTYASGVIIGWRWPWPIVKANDDS